MPSQEIDRLNLSVGVTNTPKTLRNIESLTTALSKLDDILTKVSAHGGIGGALDGEKKSGGKNNGGKRKATHSTSLLSLAKLGATIHMARRLGRAVAYIAQAGSDYTETLNLWETAMSDNLNVATKFVDKMNEAYGVSEKTLMNAQATFKNMLGSLGQISDETAYRLSEGVTQMALDYASLYNQTFEQAMYKFQAALAGQVRPIRSVSGFDITETTLYQLYRSLGGEKTMRQLTRTEKQLLSIYAIFQQMERSGTVGDLEKTMESYANQARVASESFQQIVQYSGILLTHAIQEAGILQMLNGFLIFLGDVLKSVADEYNAIQHFGDPFEATTDGALAAQKATDDLNGKLLDFDKFRSLNSGGDNEIGIDETLLNALSAYESILVNAGMEATEFANALKTASGLFDEEGVFNPDKWADIVENIKMIVTLLIGLAAMKVVTSIARHFVTFENGVFVATESLKSLRKFLPTLIADFKKLEFGVMGAMTAIALLVLGITAFVGAWDDMSGIERAIGIIVALTTAVTAFAIALHATHNTAKALMIAGMVTGGALFAYSALTQVTEFADGGLPQKGSLFVAGEAGAELVTNMGGGQSGVMNMEQLESAVARGIYVGMSSVDMKDDRPIYVNIDGQRFFSASRDIYRRNGYDVSRV